MNTMQVLLDRVLADKAAQRREAQAKAWPEKIATIERLRDATRLARESMAAATKAKQAIALALMETCEVADAEQRIDSRSMA